MKFLEQVGDQLFGRNTCASSLHTAIELGKLNTSSFEINIFVGCDVGMHTLYVICVCLI